MLCGFLFKIMTNKGLKNILVKNRIPKAGLCQSLFISTFILNSLLLSSCGLHKSFIKCCTTDQKTENLIWIQMDSVYHNDKSLTYMKLKKVISCEYLNDSIVGSKNVIELKVKNDYKTFDYFIFNQHFKLIKVVHELPPLY
jgi:hypothetical protein